MHDTSAANAPGLSIDNCLSKSLLKGGYPFVIGDRSGGLFLAFRFVDDMNTAAPSVASSRLTQVMLRRVQCPHLGSTSSHFFRLATQVKQPVLDLSLSMLCGDLDATLRVGV